jgi:hypothetical protein
MSELMQEKIDAWKKEYGKVFKVVIGGETYVYRMLKRPEYRQLQAEVAPELTEKNPAIAQEANNNLEEKLFKLCVLWPENLEIDELPAGIPSVLAPMISEASGYQIDEEPTEL